MFGVRGRFKVAKSMRSWPSHVRSRRDTPKRKGPETTVSRPFFNTGIPAAGLIRLRARERIGRANVLHGFGEGREALVQRLDRLLGRVHPQIVDLRRLRDVGVERRLREVALHFPSFVQALGARHGLERRDAVFHLLLGEGETLRR